MRQVGAWSGFSILHSPFPIFHSSFRFFSAAGETKRNEELRIENEE
jgi:hypothetical protein